MKILIHTYTLSSKNSFNFSMPHFIPASVIFCFKTSNSRGWKINVSICTIYHNLYVFAWVSWTISNKDIPKILEFLFQSLVLSDLIGLILSWGRIWTKTQFEILYKTGPRKYKSISRVIIRPTKSYIFLYLFLGCPIFIAI